MTSLEALDEVLSGLLKDAPRELQIEFAHGALRGILDPKETSLERSGSDTAKQSEGGCAK